MSTYKIMKSDGSIVEVDAAQFDAERAPAPPSTDPADYPLLPWRFKAMVDYLGSHDAISAAIGAIPDEFERAVAKSRYENATSYNFNDPLMQQIRAAIGMDKKTLSDAWMRAKDIKGS